jgi:hypothetical protein
MKYIVISQQERFNYPNLFEKQIEEKLKNGWKLQGGISVVSTMGEIYYYQALIKE